MAYLDITAQRSKLANRPSILRMFALWSSRRALAKLDASQLQDIGVSYEIAQKDARRPVWDVPTNWRN